MIKRIPLLAAALLSACASQTSLENQAQTSQQLTALSDAQQQTLTLCQEAVSLLGIQQQQQQSLQDQLNQLNNGETASSVPAEQAQCGPSSVSYELGNKQIVGEVEWVSVQQLPVALEARIDTGATTSSLSASDIVTFERDGKNWVRFTLRVQEGQDEIQVERPIVRFAEIKQASSNNIDRRPVISMLIKLGGLSEETQITLADRSHLRYPMILGRNFLKDIAVVDVSLSHSQPKPSFEDAN
ncbi:MULTISPECIES: ATP-dependent zinc protease family protein [Aliagarivorans]|uniref:ATP-dependent zinc protease family protein n=1 Tax=Aliagarivorans TaxID=882379 RepID=UPI0003FD634F|nr:MULTISPECIES: ATP-dependent zinc protease [Aliagarivorans]